MKRKIKLDLVKSKRNERGWTQEELAIAADLGLRTIQRMEAGGEASLNSIKSVASALEIESGSLEDKSAPRRIGLMFGVLSGFAGVMIGSASAFTAVIGELTRGSATSYEAGIAFGVIGLAAGLSCAFIGWMSNRYQIGRRD